MADASCYWNQVLEVKASGEESSDSILVSALSNVSIDFKRGELSCIIGTVGCGKSALIQAIVGELPIMSGSIRRNYKTLAYAAQDPWIMDGTVKENITMGLDLDQELSKV